MAIFCVTQYGRINPIGNHQSSVSSLGRLPFINLVSYWICHEIICFGTSRLMSNSQSLGNFEHL